MKRAMSEVDRETMELGRGGRVGRKKPRSRRRCGKLERSRRGGGSRGRVEEVTLWKPVGRYRDGRYKRRPNKSERLNTIFSSGGVHSTESPAENSRIIFCSPVHSVNGTPVEERCRLGRRRRRRSGWGVANRGRTDKSIRRRASRENGRTKKLLFSPDRVPVTEFFAVARLALFNFPPNAFNRLAFVCVCVCVFVWNLRENFTGRTFARSLSKRLRGPAKN